MDAILVRRMQFDFEAGLDPVVLPGRPEESYALVGLSLLMPYLEPYLIRSMNAAKAHLTDARVLDDLARFNAQEGQHYRQHKRFNDAIQRAGYPGLAALEAEVAADYERFTSTRSLRFNLAYAEGFEAFTGAMARFTLDRERLAGMAAPLRDLFEWHLVEELEHRTVAYDVYDQVCGGYCYRLFVGLYAQYHFLRFVVRVMEYLLAASPEVVQAHGGKAGRRTRDREQLGALWRYLLPRVLDTYSPRYTPHSIDLPERARALGTLYAERAVSVS